MSRRGLICILCFACIAVVFLWAFHRCLLRGMGDWLDVGERPRSADYVMALAGDDTARPFTAAALIRAGYARCAAGAHIADNPDVSVRVLPPSHENLRRILMWYGVPEKDIFILPGEAKTTFDEAAALAVFLEGRPNAKALVVTNDYHTRRSRWIFAGVFGNRADQITFVSAPTDVFPLDRWWQYEEGFTAIITEYAKLAFYIVRYGRFVYWLAALGVLALAVVCVRRAYSR